MDTTTVDGCGLGCNGALNQDCLDGTFPDVWASWDDDGWAGCTDGITQSGTGGCEYCIYGCTDDTGQGGGGAEFRGNGNGGGVATNYDPLATCDDGSCDYSVYGCTGNGTADNNPNTTTNPFGQTFFDRFGDGIAAENYNPNATNEDGSCIRSGCTDSNQSNYNPNANVDDGSCFSCNQGCMDSTQGGYDPLHDCDCNGEPENTLGTSNPQFMQLGWDSCCTPVIHGCMNTAAVNYLNAARDGGQDCSGHDLDSGVYPNAPCPTDSNGQGGNYGNTNPSNYGCDMPDVTPDTYIRVIQDISASMDDVTEPLRKAIVGPYNDPYSLRSDLQDIYANHPNWVESECAVVSNGNVGNFGCSDPGYSEVINNVTITACDQQGDQFAGCDPKYNGRAAYEAHVSHVQGWEYHIGWAANLSPIHNHPLGATRIKYLIGGFWGPNAIEVYQGISVQTTIDDLITGSGNTPNAIAEQKLMNTGLTTFSDAEKVFIITVGDEVNHHYTSGVSGSTNASSSLEEVRKGCNVESVANGWSNLLGYNNPNGDTVNGNDFDVECGDLRYYGPLDWSNFTSQTDPANNTWLEYNEGALLKDLTNLRSQLINGIQADGSITYGCAFLAVKTSGLGGYGEGNKQIYDCVVEGDDGANGCWAFGDFTGTQFSSSQGGKQGMADIRNVADLNGWDNGSGGKINFTVPDVIVPAVSQEQQTFYNEIKAAMGDLGISI